MSSFPWADVGQWLAAAAPFAGQTRSGDTPPGGDGDGGSGPPHHTPSVRRIMEGLLPAAVVGVVVLYGTVNVIGADIEHCKARLERLDQLIELIRQDIYTPRWQHRDDVPSPRHPGHTFYPDEQEFWI